MSHCRHQGPPTARRVPGRPTGAGHDELIDVVAAVCAGDDPAAVAGLHACDELRVPPELIR